MDVEPYWELLSVMSPVEVTAAEAAFLRDAASAPDYTVTDMTHRTRLRTARQLASKRLLLLLEGTAHGWESGMWAATPTCPGWNALWRAHGDTHTPGCGSEWGDDGVCTGCRALRRLDSVAFDRYLMAADETEREFHDRRTQLWCDEHGYARRLQWTTDKTCRQEGSPYHQVSYSRVS